MCAHVYACGDGGGGVTHQQNAESSPPVYRHLGRQASQRATHASSEWACQADSRRSPPCVESETWAAEMRGSVSVD